MSDIYVPGVGPVGAKLMILGEAPSFTEVQMRRPFVGPAGRELDKLLRDAEIDRNKCWVTNVFKYELPILDRPTPAWVRAKMVGIDVDQCLNELQEEINQIKPNCILALGKTALWALTGKTKISDYRGSIMLGMGRKLVSTYHPAHLIHTAQGGEIKGYWNRQVMIFDFKRAKKQAEFPEVILPNRTLRICQSSAQLAEFLARYDSYDHPAIDIEADGNCIPVCVGIAFTPYEGLVVPLWNADDISYIPDADMVQIWLLLDRLFQKHAVIGHNFKYDHDKLHRLGFRLRLHSDTMLKAFAINPELPKSLAFNTSIYTEEPFYKHEGMYEGSIRDLMMGCARDACVTKEIDIAMEKDLDELGLRKFYENFLMKLHELYLSIESEGFCLDNEAREELIRKYIAWSEKLQLELFELTGSIINVNSPKQVYILLYETLKLPRRAGTGEEELTSLLNSVKHETQRRIIEIILEKRRVDKTISTYLLAVPDFDGKMRTSYYLCLETGRTATGQQDPPIRPRVTIVENGVKKQKSIGASFQVMTKHGDIGADVRRVYVPEQGHLFLQADSSQAEARVVSLLAKDERMLSLYDTHDIHALTASWFFGGTEEQYSKKILGYECPQRFIGKTLRHAGERGAKKRRAAMEVNTNARKYKIDIRITEAQAEAALNIFHRMCPNIRGVYFAEVIDCLEKTRILTAPLPYGIDAPCGGKRIFYERWGDELFRQAFSYLPQRAVSDNTKAAMLRIKSRLPQIRIIMESHDAILFMVPERHIDEWAEIIKEEMERPIDFSCCSLPRRPLSIPCELEIGENYCDMKKFSLHEASYEKDR